MIDVDKDLAVASMSLSVPVILGFALFRSIRSGGRFRSAVTRIYHMIVPLRPRRAPLAMTFLLLWIWLGAVISYTRLWTILWPQEIGDRPPDSAVRLYVGGMMMLGGLLMLYGKLAARSWPMAIGSAISFGISGVFLARLAGVLWSGVYLWPEILFSAFIWLAITWGFLVSLIENKRVVDVAERLKV